MYMQSFNSAQFGLESTYNIAYFMVPRGVQHSLRKYRWFSDSLQDFTAISFLPAMKLGEKITVTMNSLWLKPQGSFLPKYQNPELMLAVKLHQV